MHVPERVGVAHYALQPHERVLAGMCHNCLNSGGAAVDLLVSMMQRAERGVPDVPLRIMIDSRWLTNQTVLKSKA